MKFTFEKDMVKGQCIRCTMMQCFKNVLGEDLWVCLCDGHREDSIDKRSERCPLEEAKETIWHPYPKEKPAEEYGYYLVTIAGYEVHEAIWSVDGFYLADGLFGECRAVTAWAEKPEPYKESE